MERCAVWRSPKAAHLSRTTSRTHISTYIRLVLALCLASISAADGDEDGDEKEDGPKGNCVEWASSVPEHLTTWDLGMLTLMAVVFYALGQAQSISRLRMPYLRHSWQTAFAATTSMLILCASTVFIIVDISLPASNDTIWCDVMRVIWTVTPVVAGTAGAGCLLLLWVAFLVSLNQSPPVARDKAKKSRFSIPPSDSYHNGSLAIRSWSPWLILNGIWLLGLGTAILFTLHGDVLNGLMSAAGIIAVMADVSLPEWNDQTLRPERSDRMRSLGREEKTTNTVGLDCIELNVIGEHDDDDDQTAIVVQPKKTSAFWSWPRQSKDSVFYEARIYALSGAHAAATDFKGKAFTSEPYSEALNDAGQLADVVINQTVEVRSQLLNSIKEADVHNPAHRAAFTALVASILDAEPWRRTLNVPRDDQCARLRALSVAQTLLFKFVGSAGGSTLRNDARMHNGEECLCPIHRWNRWHDLMNTAEGEAKYLLGSEAKLPTVRAHQSFADDLWKKIVQRASRSKQFNKSLLIVMYLNALRAKGAIETNGDEHGDYYPVFDLELVPYGEKDFEKGCSVGVQPRGEKSRGRPLIDGTAARRSVDGFAADYSNANIINHGNQSEKLVPFHPKVIRHVGVRVLWKAILVQLAVWILISLRLLAL